jgi:hypothetical protein
VQRGNAVRPSPSTTSTVLSFSGTVRVCVPPERVSWVERWVAPFAGGAVRPSPLSLCTTAYFVQHVTYVLEEELISR